MFHGQLNQDKWVLEQLVARGFTIGAPGFYVDVGAFDGRKYSNTWLFERIGWNGICVEAQELSFKHLQANRPNAINVHSIVTNNGRDVLFVENNAQPMLSKVTKTHVQGLSKPSKTLTQILEECDAPRKIDYLSIDVEGMDYEVLEGLKIENYDITCITIEHNGEDQGSDIANWLWANNYLVRMIDFDFFAVKDNVRVQ